MKSSTTTLALVLTATMGTTGIAHAAGNPFALNTLSQGYQLAAADKAMEGKCGEAKNAGQKDAKAQDGKCGGSKNSQATDTKAKDGKCGEGKCGAKKNKPLKM